MTYSLLLVGIGSAAAAFLACRAARGHQPRMNPGDGWVPGQLVSNKLYALGIVVQVHDDALRVISSNDFYIWPFEVLADTETTRWLVDRYKEEAQRLTTLYQFAKRGLR